MTDQPSRSGYHTDLAPAVGGIASRVSLHVRRKMFAEFARRFPDPSSVLDVGVTSESVAPEANFFEDMFPHKGRITAVGIEDGTYLEQRYPGLKFVRVQPGTPLPFADDAFEVAFSNAVIEHVVDPTARQQFLAELVRVSRHVFVTTPNRFFPVEAHTGVPFLHALAPRIFYWLLDRGWFSKFYNTTNLRLLTGPELAACGERLGLATQLVPVRFCGFISNWLLIVSKSR